ncbi:MAG TPA: class I SAM-dependent methyltransferase [Chthoniobacterales bacterium]|nr:class I SAM-dependent methyltransferase [Chthoniobacterales bacterium]
MYPTQKILHAIAKRSGLRQAGTTAYRIVDGGGDNLPEWVIDDFNGNWLVGVKPGQEMPNLDPALGYQSLYGKLLSNEERKSPTFLAGQPITQRFLVQEHRLNFWVDFQAGYSQGIFLDQRINRQRLRNISGGKKVLNTFAYTCAFGVAAAASGASTTNVDLSRFYLAWGRENYLANAIDDQQHEFIYGDVFDWLKRFAKKGRHFDLIILDPPTFSRDRDGRVFRAETDYGELLESALSITAKDGELLCCMNAHRLSRIRFEKILRAKLPKTTSLVSADMPEDFPGSDYLKSFWVRP